ncbi:YadA C-terminal domain-containing protein [Vibrio bathopelagicus]|uniref:YadA C-terminal domain-containing protein n=1 Tax=Vibrio bathopelagicus TaxID=2777577 RepID=UPI001863D960|nr:YadA C-terminal domain-containing protein [Vibrio bathopelagicus]
MKKSIIAVSLTTVFSIPAFAQDEIHNPIWGEAVQPTLPSVDNSVPGVPVRPQPPTPANPIEQIPSNPIELPKPTQPIEQTPTQPQLPVHPTLPEPTQPPMDNSPERPAPDYGDTPDISGPTEAERSSALEMSQAELQSSFEAMATEYNAKFNDHAEQMDGIRASLHAVTNARPFVTNGEFAIGAGVGFAGSKEALALGGAYGVNEQLSVSGTFHYETSGKYSSSDVAGGVGVQYNFK